MTVCFTVVETKQPLLRFSPVDFILFFLIITGEIVFTLIYRVSQYTWDPFDC